MTVHTMGFTYAPKEPAVRDGICRHTFRKENDKRPKKAGDELLMHGWTGRPYRSPWSWRRREVIKRLTHYRMSLSGIYQGDIEILDAAGERLTLLAGRPSMHVWGSAYARRLAVLDHIEPATGYELCGVLMDMGTIVDGEITRVGGIEW